MYAIKRFVIGPDEWTEIVSQTRANTFALINVDGAPMTVCTDPADETTYKPVPAGMQESVMSAAPAQSVLGVKPLVRFPEGGTICWVRQASATPPTSTVVLTQA